MKKVIFFLGFLLGIGSVALWASGLLWRISNQPTTAAKSSESPEDFKEKLEFYGKRADDLERLLTLLLGGSTIYALAVGYNAYQQAKDAKDKLDNLEKEAKKQTETLAADSQKQIQAIKDLVNDSKGQIMALQTQATTKTQELVADSKEQIQKMESQIARNFPLFQDMDLAISTITHKILHLLPTMDVVEGKFQQLSEQEKQEILFYEKAMSTFEFFNTVSLRKEISGIFNGLGNFYALKFKDAEAKKKQQNQPANEWQQEIDKQDRERASFYLNYAIRQNPKNVGALNDRGYFALVFEAPSNMQQTKAKEDFLASLDADEDQQRARYNLALIEHRATNYEKSLEIIECALKKAKWQQGPVEERIPDLWYNHACSLAGLAGIKSEPERTKLLECALQELEKIAAADKGGWLELHKSLEDDLKIKSQGKNKDGDLVALSKVPELAPCVEAVRQQISSKAART